jgi:hypothetical protein
LLATWGRIFAATALATLASAFASAPASGTSEPLASGQTQLKLNASLRAALRQEGVAVEPLGPARLKGRKLTLPVASGTFDQSEDSATLVQSGGLRLVSGGSGVALRRLTFDASGKSLRATVAGTRMRLARLYGVSLEREGFDAHLEVKRLLLSGAAVATLNRVLDLPDVLRPGRSLGSVNGLGEATSVGVGFGTIAIGGPGTVFSKLESLDVEMGLWGSSGKWAAPGETYFLFPVQPATVATDASAGLLTSEANAGMTMQIYDSPPREMLLRDPRIDLAARELSARVSALSADDPGVTAPIATLDYGAAKFQVRPRVGAFELMGIRAVANQFIADQLNARFGTPGMFQAGETLARITVNLHAPVAD